MNNISAHAGAMVPERLPGVHPSSSGTNLGPGARAATEGQSYESDGFRRVVFAGEAVSFTRRVQYDLMRVSKSVQYGFQSFDGKRREVGAPL